MHQTGSSVPDYVEAHPLERFPCRPGMSGVYSVSTTLEDKTYRSCDRTAREQVPERYHSTQGSCTPLQMLTWCLQPFCWFLLSGLACLGQTTLLSLSQHVCYSLSQSSGSVLFVSTNTHKFPVTEIKVLLTGQSSLFLFTNTSSRAAFGVVTFSGFSEKMREGFVFLCSPVLRSERSVFPVTCWVSKLWNHS